MEHLPSIHPGEVLREEYLVPLGRSAEWLAEGIRMSPTATAELVAGNRPVTPAIALRLSRFFGSSAEFWVNLQASYDWNEERRQSGEPVSDEERVDEWQLRVQELERRRAALHAQLAAGREELAEELASIQPLAPDALEPLAAAAIG